MPNYQIEISDMLLKCGFQPHIKGYRHSQKALELILADFGKANAVAKLFEEVGETFNTTGRRVDKDIDHAVKSAWDRNPMFRELFPYSGGSAPGNAEFLATIAERIRLQKLLEVA